MALNLQRHGILAMTLALLTAIVAASHRPATAQNRNGNDDAATIAELRRQVDELRAINAMLEARMKEAVARMAAMQAELEKMRAAMNAMNQQNQPAQPSAEGYPLAFATPGRIVEIMELGDDGAVEKGAIIARLDDRQQALAIAQAQAEFQVFRAKLDMVNRNSEALNAEIEAAREAVKLAEQELARQRELHERGMVPERAVGDAKAKLADITAHLAKLEAKVTHHRAETEAMRAQARIFELKIEMAHRERDNCMLLAPANGRVVRVLGGPGMVVAAGQPVVNFVPNR